MKSKIEELESKLRIANIELERLKLRSSGEFNPRERFILEQTDLICRQLEGWILPTSCYTFMLVLC